MAEDEKKTPASWQDSVADWLRQQNATSILLLAIVGGAIWITRDFALTLPQQKEQERLWHTENQKAFREAQIDITKTHSADIDKLTILFDRNIDRIEKLAMERRQNGFGSNGTAP